METELNRPWLDLDELEVIRSFPDAEVRFVIVGGRAVQFHGHARLAKDLDLLVEPSAENWPRLQAALRPVKGVATLCLRFIASVSAMLSTKAG
jgi:hypothetical protein